MTKKQTVHILLPLPLLNGAYAYTTSPKLLDNQQMQVGTFVQVPLGNQKKLGIVWAIGIQPRIAPEKIKPIIHIYNCPPLPADIIALIKYISAYTVHTLGAVLKMAMPCPQAITQPKTTTAYTINPHHTAKITPKRQGVLEAIRQNPHITRTDIQNCTGVTTAVIRAMETADILQPHTVLQMASTDYAPPTYISPLNTEQQSASTAIIQSQGKFKVWVLDGVTGSGKTETYFEAIAHTLNQGKQVLVLLPEIALSTQWEQRFSKRFGFKPHAWHSEITPHNRNTIWTGVLHGTVQVIVGARSALHMPFENLGLIIVDEEHDGAYKQQDTVLYNARDMAIVRAKLCHCPIVLATATPSLQTWANMVQGRYKSLQLNQRYTKTAVTPFVPIDITKEKLDKHAFITPTLHRHIAHTLNKRLQTLLFLNRKGYAPLSLCRKCGYRFKCNNCDAWLIQHKYKQHIRLQCHHCGYNIPCPRVCPDCGATDSLHACGPGVERIYEEIKTTYPNAKVFIATADTIRTRTQAQNFVTAMQNGDIDIVIGTQVIAKGYDFANLHLVGVIDGDMTLSGMDLRAGEHTFQLLHQVGGRAGRGHVEGVAFIQTTDPKHTVIQALINNDRNTFLNTELEIRKILQQPPFYRLVNITISGNDKQRVEHTAKHLARTAPRGENMRILGPADPMIALLRGKYRKQILVNAPKSVKIQPLLKKWIFSYTQKPSTIRIQIDIDPYGFG